ncbi:MAG: MurR/RpiR family transcriptional regulator [Gammaproteobacteria bacterium]|nr:MurR/RpiR family transcriptional regulator [Gammaproteobacteria bacterium]
MNVLEQITLNIENLSKSERKVADVIRDNPKTAIHSSIATLAKMANVSEPTVNRFCRRMDTKGFPDFKLHLAQSLANGTPYLSRHIDESDSVEDYTSKIYETTLACLAQSRKMIDTNAINRAVDILTQAKKISFFGLGASSVVAQDALNKFFRFNVPVLSFQDALMQRMSCANSAEGDVVVLISHTGRTKSLVELAQMAKENDATVIAITASGSPLAEACHLLISSDIPEDTDLYMPMNSRIGQLVIIDVLATGFTLRRGTKFRVNLQKVTQGVRDSRFNKPIDEQ